MKSTMKRRSVWLLTIGGLLLAVTVLTVYLLTTGKGHSADLNDLRARFNQDRGKARLLMLLSPT